VANATSVAPAKWLPRENPKHARLQLPASSLFGQICPPQAERFAAITIRTVNAKSGKYICDLLTGSIAFDQQRQLVPVKEQVAGARRKRQAQIVRTAKIVGEMAARFF
jgi:hypothetical protein